MIYGAGAGLGLLIRLSGVVGGLFLGRFAHGPGEHRGDPRRGAHPGGGGVMAYGISTDAYFWPISQRAPRPMSPTDMLHDTTGLGGRVFQICDYPAIESYDRAEPADVRATARDLGPASEPGTRGVRAAWSRPGSWTSPW
ncbi:hypothetical protein R6V09_19410, partial [Streptomyces sp. W16]|nr:hypothetical protein [Streptomyces sp. W16]